MNGLFFDRIVAPLIVVGWVSFTVGCVPAVSPLSVQEEQMLEGTLVTLLERATVGLRRGDTRSLDEAYASLRVARELSPNDPRVLDGIGCVEWRLGNIDLAEYFFREAIAVSPEYDRPYAHLALVARDRGDTRAAEELLLMAIQINPLNYRARNNYAVEVLENGEDRESRKAAYESLLAAIQTAGEEDPVMSYNLRELHRQ